MNDGRIPYRASGIIQSKTSGTHSILCLVLRLRASWTVFLFGLTLFLPSCRNDISEIRAIADPQHLPIQTSLDARYILSEQGEKRNVLEAQILNRYTGDENYLEAVNGFSLAFYDSSGTETARLKAENGIYNEDQKQLKAWGDVVLTNTGGERLETEILYFDQDSSRIYTDQSVRITTPGAVILGEGLESNDSFTRYRILRPKGELMVNEETN